MARKDISDLMVCKAVKRRIDSGFNFTCTIETLIEWTGESEKVCYAAMERANDNGFIEWGVSLRTAWLTDEGKKLLEDSDA